MKLSTLLKVGAVGTALVMLPRRSSKKADKAKGVTNDTSGKKCCGCGSDKANGKSCGSKCLCPLCKIGKCPLCQLGKCPFCKCGNGKKSDK